MGSRIGKLAPPDLRRTRLQSGRTNAGQDQIERSLGHN